MRLDPGLTKNEDREEDIDLIADELADLGVWDRTYQATVTASPVTLPATVNAVEEVYWNGKLLYPTDPTRVPKTIPTGEPVWYWVEIDPTASAEVTFTYKLYTYPAINASGTIKIAYIGKAATPIGADAAGNDEDTYDLEKYGIPKAWHRLMVFGVAALEFERNLNGTQADRYQRQYERFKDRQYLADLERLNTRRKQNRDLFFDRPTLSSDTYISPFGMEVG